MPINIELTGNNNQYTKGDISRATGLDMPQIQSIQRRRFWRSLYNYHKFGKKIAASDVGLMRYIAQIKGEQADCSLNESDLTPYLLEDFDHQVDDGMSCFLGASDNGFVPDAESQETDLPDFDSGLCPPANMPKPLRQVKKYKITRAPSYRPYDITQSDWLTGFVSGLLCSSALYSGGFMGAICAASGVGLIYMSLENSRELDQIEQNFQSRLKEEKEVRALKCFRILE